ncbi:hypothetical protein AB0C12_05895 [Actinoplanes sp. NPDC048967]|uniref:hypothetical protein n=1 Tax=Actinoplanes sp. NPDC048967 TaxID=3155269 RepID=UPI0033FDE14D
MAIICAQCGHRNPDGSRFCTNRDCGAFLAWTDPNAGPPARPPRPEPARPLPRQGDATRWGASVDGHSDVAASMTLTDATLAVVPGETASTTVSVHNGGGQVEQFAITVLGPTAGWAEIEPAVLAVYPDARAEAVIRWSPPRQASTAAGRAPFTVRAASILHRGLQVHATGVLDVAEFRALTATLTPQTTSGRWQTSHRIQLTNEGNVVEPVQLKATDPAGRIKFSLPAGELPVPPGSQSIDMSVRPPWRFFGRPAGLPFQVIGTPRPPVTPVRLDGTREVVPLIAGWIPKVATGLLALGIAAAAFILATDPFAPDDLAGGEASAPPPGVSVPATPGKASAPQVPPGGGSEPAQPKSQPATSAPAKKNDTPWAVVDGTGALVSTKGATTVTPLGTGRFEVTFDRAVDDCVFLGTVAASGGQPVPESGLVFTASGSNRNSVLVQTRNIDGAAAAHPFHLQIRCSVGDTAVVAGDRVVRGTDGPRVRRTADGQYELRFDRSIRRCSFVATIGGAGAQEPPAGLINVGTGQQDEAAILVGTRGGNGAGVDLPFHLQTRCSGLFVIVDADGRTVRDSEVDEVGRGEPGVWEVNFNRDVSKCSYAASLGDADGSPADLGGVVYAASGSRPTSVQIHTRKLDPGTGVPTLADAPFHLQVVC